MKVDVLQVAEATFPRFAWWSNWIDICLYDYEHRPYLLQMRVNRRNAKQFRNRCISGLIYRQVGTSTVGDLMPMTNNREVRHA